MIAPGCVGGDSPGRYTWDGYAKPCSPPEPRFECQPPSQLLGYQIEYDVQTEAGPTFVPPGREEWIERAALGVLAHSNAVIGHEQLDIIVRRRENVPRFDLDGAGSAVGKGVNHAVKEQVGQHLPIGAGIAVHENAGGNIDAERDVGFSQDRAQAGNNVVGRFAQIELSAVRVTAIDGYLFEGLHELAGALKVGNELIGGIAVDFQELTKSRSPQRSGRNLVGKILAAPGEARSNGQADPDWIVDFMCHAGHQAP